MRNVHSILVLAASLLPLASVQAAPADLPETGQVTCFGSNIGGSFACANTGQDGEHRAGVAWPNPRFIGGIGDKAACVTDRLTGLMWVRAPDNSPLDWRSARVYANDLTLCGFSDWRLPNIRELESLVNSEAVSPADFLNSHGFANVSGGIYWSSSYVVGIPTNAWIVVMSDGDVYIDYKGIRNQVWPVRAGQ